MPAAVMLIIMTVFGGCTSVKTDYKTVPYGAIPGDCLFYFTADPGLIPEDALDSRIKPLLKRTREITGAFEKGDFYLLLRGKYPDSFIEKRITESPDWEKDEAEDYYSNKISNLSVFFARNNYIFLTDYKNRITSVEPMKRVLGNYGSGTYPEVLDYFASRDEELLFQLYSDRGQELVSLLSEKRLKSLKLKGLEINLKDNAAENNDNSYCFESSLSFVSEKDAKIFSTIVKLILFDLVRDNKSGISVEQDKKMSVKLENSSILISDIIVSEKITDEILKKILTGQVF